MSVPMLWHFCFPRSPEGGIVWKILRLQQLNSAYTASHGNTIRISELLHLYLNIKTNNAAVTEMSFLCLSRSLCQLALCQSV